MTEPVIAVFTKNWVNPAYAAARLAVDQVAAEAGARTIHYAPQTPDDVAEQKALVTEALAARPAAVVLNPTDDVAMQEDLVRLAAAGIPVTLFINRMQGPALTFVGSDDEAIGRRTATALFEALGGTGRVVGLEGPQAAPTSRARVRGLRETLGRFPGIELLDMAVGHLQQPPAKSAMAGLLDRHARIDGVWTANDLMAFGALDALDAAGRQAKVVGVNGLPAAIEHIERGTMLASCDFSAFNIAAIAARSVLRHLRGEPVPREIMVPAELIDRGNCARWKVPFAERPCPTWEEIVR
ncbi:MAG: sugar ABC transporter substrate-binding protein [Enhydrobacter sp.]